MNNKTWYAVQPDSVRQGLSDVNTNVAIFKWRNHAEKWGKNLYGKYFIIIEVVQPVSL